jgi:hypothetical protein
VSPEFRVVRFYGESGASGVAAADADVLYRTPDFDDALVALEAARAANGWGDALHIVAVPLVVAEVAA